jgi:hypothetical protein
MSQNCIRSGKRTQMYAIFTMSSGSEVFFLIYILNSYSTHNDDSDKNNYAEISIHYDGIPKMILLF